MVRKIDTDFDLLSKSSEHSKWSYTANPDENIPVNCELKFENSSCSRNGKHSHCRIFTSAESELAYAALQVKTLFSQVYQSPPAASLNASLSAGSSALPPGVSSTKQDSIAGAPVFPAPRFGDSGIGLQEPGLYSQDVK